MSLAQVTAAVSNLPFVGTDCALPMLDALKHNLKVDAFIGYNDSETWAGKIHPLQALREYRQKTGIPAKLIVVGMTSNGFTIADPEVAGMLDVVGFSTNTPFPPLLTSSPVTLARMREKWKFSKIINRHDWSA